MTAQGGQGQDQTLAAMACRSRAVGSGPGWGGSSRSPKCSTAVSLLVGAVVHTGMLRDEGHKIKPSFSDFVRPSQKCVGDVAHRQGRGFNPQHNEKGAACPGLAHGLTFYLDRGGTGLDSGSPK